MAERFYFFLRFGFQCFIAGYFLFLFSCQSSSSEVPFLLGGIQVNEADQDEWISTLEEVGMNTISVTVYARQGIWNKNHLWWNEDQKKVIDEIRAAKRKGLKVVLIPRLLLDSYFPENAFLWHGMVFPKTEGELYEWFKWYTNFVDTWAKICEEEDVDVFALGSEMRLLTATRPVKELPNLEAYYLNHEKQAAYITDRMTFSDQIPAGDLWVRGQDVSYQSLGKYLQDEVAAKVTWAKEVSFADAPDPVAAINERRATILDHWYTLIAQVRKSYQGQLTYAANFDNYQNVKFWDSLDLIGINAYFKLRTYRPQASSAEQLEAFQNSWDTIFTDIQKLQSRDSLPQKVLFTELGYIYRKNCTVMPWEGFGFSITEVEKEKNLLIWSQQKYDLEERALAVKALHQSHQKFDLLGGILYWKLTTKDYHIPYEPFVLHIKPEVPDPLQIELLRFLQPKNSQ